MPKKGKVSFAPSTFVDDSGGLLEASLEDVVAIFLDKEKQRGRLFKDDDNQQIDVVGSRVVPTGLLMALDSAAGRLGVTRSVLTLCASHQIAVWLECQSRIKDLINVFNITRDAANDYGYPDLYDSMQTVYTFADSSPRQATFKTIRWVKSSLSSYTKPLGIPAGMLFAAGLCYSLSRSEKGGKGTSSKYLLREVRKFESHVEEQFIRVFGFHDLVRLRVEAEGGELENVKTRKQENEKPPENVKTAVKHENV